MFKNYIKIAFRNLRKYKVYSLINILGLAVGMACFLLIVFYIQFEQSYDEFHQNVERVYKVVRLNTRGDQVERRVNTGAPLAPLMMENLSGLEAAVRLTCFRGELIGHGEDQFIERSFFFADESVFEVFTFPLVQGDQSTALKEPFSVVLTKEMAVKYFGDENPIGKTLSYKLRDKTFDFQVTGILAEIPRNSHLNFDFLASYRSLQPIVGEWFLTKHWDSPTHTYVLLEKGYEEESLERLLPEFSEKHVDKWSFTSVSHELLPLKDVYFHSPGPAIGRWGNSQFLFVLTLVSVFIIVIACINFMNLATARSGIRAKEIGMRKVIGAQRPQLIRQFIGESLVFSFLAVFLSVLLVRLFLPTFSHLIGEGLGINILKNPEYMGTIFLTALAVGIVAGSYPAFFLSSFRPSTVLKGEIRSGGSVIWVRKALVVGQFVLSIALITCSLFVVQQINFIKNMDVGFNKNHVVTIPVQEGSVLERSELLKNRWLQNSSILSVTASSMEPGVTSQNGINAKARGIEDLEMGIIYVDHDFVKTLEIEIAEGRDFSTDVSTDATEAILMNKTALERFGWDRGVGEPMELYWKMEGKIVPGYQGRVVGVLQNFYFRDLTTPMQPILVKIDPRRFQYFLVRIRGETMKQAIDHLRKTWKEFQFEYPFEFSFLEEDMNHVYRNFENFALMTRYGTLWAILISCLGLFGLASFTVERRTKEIGIRKVLGASVTSLIGLVNKEFLRLVALATIIAWLLAYYGMLRFLQYFAYRTKIQIWVFLLAGILALLVSLLTVSFQAIKTALTNPAEALRHE